jgi:K+ transporter
MPPRGIQDANQNIARGALAATEFFHIPPNRVIELGGQVEI